MPGDERFGVGGAGKARVLRELTEGEVAEEVLIEGEALEILKSIDQRLAELLELMTLAFGSSE